MVARRTKLQSSLTASWYIRSPCSSSIHVPSPETSLSPLQVVLQQLYCVVHELYQESTLCSLFLSESRHICPPVFTSPSGVGCSRAGKRALQLRKAEGWHHRYIVSAAGALSTVTAGCCTEKRGGEQAVQEVAEGDGGIFARAAGCQSSRAGKVPISFWMLGCVLIPLDNSQTSDSALGKWKWCNRLITDRPTD